MSLFRRVPERAPEQRDAAPYTFAQWLTARSDSAVSETSAGSIDGALRQSVVYRCVTLVAGTIATMPVHAKRGRVTLDPAPSIIQRPSPMMRRSVWVEAAVTSMLLRGGAYGLVDDVSMSRTGWPTSVDLLHPDRVTWTAADGWMLDAQPIEEYPLGPLWHVPLHVLPGSPKGLNPLEYARRTVYASLVAHEFGTNFFRDGGHPSAILATDGDPGKAGAEALKQTWMAATRGTNREPAVLPQSVKYEQIQINPDDSQFIESMRLSDEELARFFGCDPAMVGVHTGGTSLTYSNLPDRRDDFKQFTLLLPMYRLEEGMTDLLPRPQDVKFNPAGLLRASLADRYGSYKVAAEINNLTGETFLSVDEMRALEDREPLPEEAPANV
jgi:HK97 family phage portal protein